MFLSFPAQISMKSLFNFFSLWGVSLVWILRLKCLSPLLTAQVVLGLAFQYRIRAQNGTGDGGMAGDRLVMTSNTGGPVILGT